MSRAKPKTSTETIVACLRFRLPSATLDPPHWFSENPHYVMASPETIVSWPWPLLGGRRHGAGSGATGRLAESAACFHADPTSIARPSAPVGDNRLTP